MLKIINPSTNTYDTMLFISLLQKGKSTSSKSMDFEQSGGGGGGLHLPFLNTQKSSLLPNRIFLISQLPTLNHSSGASTLPARAREEDVSLFQISDFNLVSEVNLRKLG
jgi:hypothetical protein